MSANNGKSPAARVMDEAIELVIQERSPYPQKAAFVDEGESSVDAEIRQAVDQGRAIVLVAVDGSTLLSSHQVARCTEGKRSEWSWPRWPPARTIVAAVIATPHMLVGAACASRARTVKGALAIGVLTHLALDAVPHRDYRLRAVGGLALCTDMTTGSLAVVRLSGGSQVQLAGAIGGLLPDVLALTERALVRSPVGWAHATAHTDSRPSPLLSASIQGLTAFLGALALAKASPK